ncbi:MAG: hypothetical protein JNM85_08610 [Chthonomonas sp.]|nr:hypothetical protein [Chthonomonas sp.]
MRTTVLLSTNIGRGRVTTLQLRPDWKDPMPELPDIELYAAALRQRIVGQPLQQSTVKSLFALRSVEPPMSALAGAVSKDILRFGKRLVFVFDAPAVMVTHLMLAGRLLWDAKPTSLGKALLASWQFPTGTLYLTEAGTKRRASITLFPNLEAARGAIPAALEPLECTEQEFLKAVGASSRTLKRALIDPATLSGIGNAYSDEILHHARLSPVRLTNHLDNQEWSRLYCSTQHVLGQAMQHLKDHFGDRFPGRGQITAFRPEFAAHGKFGQPCPVCGVPIQRIRYAENETNYCPRCQNEDRLLSDRSLARLLKADWPRTVEELLEGKQR